MRIAEVGKVDNLAGVRKLLVTAVLLALALSVQAAQGAGTGTINYGWKGGIGTASRKLDAKSGGYTVGVLAQCNYGLRDQLRVAGVPVGREIKGDLVWSAANQTAGAEMGSIIVVLATDAPLLPHQLKRLAKRIPLGLARNGSVAGNGSGDIFIAFSTANAGAAKEKGMSNINSLPNAQMGALFEATVQATEEAVINALVAAETMTGIDGHKVIALPHDRMREVLQRHNLLTK